MIQKTAKPPKIEKVTAKLFVKKYKIFAKKQ